MRPEFEPTSIVTYLSLIRHTKHIVIYTTMVYAVHTLSVFTLSCANTNRKSIKNIKPSVAAINTPYRNRIAISGQTVAYTSAGTDKTRLRKTPIHLSISTVPIIPSKVITATYTNVCDKNSTVSTNSPNIAPVITLCFKRMLTLSMCITASPAAMPLLNHKLLNHIN